MQVMYPCHFKSRNTISSLVLELWQMKSEKKQLSFHPNLFLAYANEESSWSILRFTSHMMPLVLCWQETPYICETNFDNVILGFILLERFSMLFFLFVWRSCVSCTSLHLHIRTSLGLSLDVWITSRNRLEMHLLNVPHVNFGLCIWLSQYAMLTSEYIYS